jgi:hypothetical protein
MVNLFSTESSDFVFISQYLFSSLRSRIRDVRPQRYDRPGFTVEHGPKCEVSQEVITAVVAATFCGEEGRTETPL